MKKFLVWVLLGVIAMAAANGWIKQETGEMLIDIIQTEIVQEKTAEEANTSSVLTGN